MKKERVLKEFEYINEYGSENEIKLIEEYWDFTNEKKIDERTIELRIVIAKKGTWGTTRFYKRKSKALEEFENLERLYK